MSFSFLLTRCPPLSKVRVWNIIFQNFVWFWNKKVHGWTSVPTWGQALFSFRFVNNIPAGKAKRKETLIFSGSRQRECMRTAKIGPDLRLLQQGFEAINNKYFYLANIFTVAAWPFSLSLFVKHFATVSGTVFISLSLISQFFRIVLSH